MFWEEEGRKDGRTEESTGRKVRMLVTNEGKQAHVSGIRSSRLGFVSQDWDLSLKVGI